MQAQIRLYPASDPDFATSLESAFVSIGGRPISDEGIAAAVEALLRVSYPLATLVDHPRAADGEPAWEAFRDDAVRDAEMLKRSAGGDALAFEQLYDRHSAYAFGLALRITRDRALAEDVVQEAFLNLWRTASSYDPARASVRTWLLAITHRRAIDALRRRRAPTAPLEMATEAPLLDARLRTPDVWAEVSARLDQRTVRRALTALPSPQRIALELAYFGGLTQAEMSAQLRVPLGTVKSRVRLGLGRLAALLADGSGDAANPRSHPVPGLPDVRGAGPDGSGHINSA